MTYENEAKFESILFIKTAIGKLIRSKLKEHELFGKLELKVFYHSTFAIMNVEIHLSHQGKAHSDKVIGSVIAAIKFLNSRDASKLEEMYGLYKKELAIAFNTKGSVSSRKLAEILSSKVPKFGLTNAYSAGEILNVFNYAAIRNILYDMVVPENMIIIFTGDFTKGQAYSQHLKLEDALSKRVTSEFNMESKRKQTGSIQLDEKDDLTPYYFHKQTVTASEIKFLYDRASNVHFGEFERNPYAIPDQEYER